MKSILLGVVLVAANLHANDAMPRVAACLDYQSVEFNGSHRAKYVAARIFGQIGVKIEWSLCNKKRREDIRIQFITKAPEDLPPGVLAQALPYEGKTIEVFYDRVQRGSRSYLGDVLGHVMAHEIAHALQGIARHSESGVMKANWTPKDRDAMSFRPLQFTPYDADLIHSGISKRAGRRASALAASSRRP